MGKGASAYSKLENGITKPTLERITKLGEIYQVNPMELIKTENQTFNHCKQKGNWGTGNTFINNDLEKLEQRVVRIEQKFIEILERLVNKSK